MTNAWSLLYDEMSYSKKSLKDAILNNMNDSENTETEQVTTETTEQYFTSITDGSDELQDVVLPEEETTTDIVASSQFIGNQIDLNLESTEKNGFWKYEEDLTMKEIRDYLSGTYRSHYTSQDSKTQTLDLIESIGDAEPFCRSNAIKYLSRFGKKNGKSKQDILKAIHYCILLYHFSGLHKQPKGNYETF